MSACLDRATNRAYALFGEGAVYADRAGVLIPCTVVLDTDLSRYGDVADVSAATFVVAVRVSEVFEKPRRGDVFQIQTGKFAGLTITASGVLTSDEFEHKVAGA